MRPSCSNTLLLSQRPWLRNTVIRPRRPERPAACPARLQASPAEALLHQDLGALEVEAEADLAQAGVCHGFAQARLVFGVEQQEAAAAGADELAAQRPVAQRQPIPLINRR